MPIRSAFDVHRRALLGQGVSLAYLLGPLTTSSGRLSGNSLARLARTSHAADVRFLIVNDRLQSRWCRVDRKPDVPSKLAFRSLDRFTSCGQVDQDNGGWWLIDEPILQSGHAGASRGLGVDSSAEIQAALDAAASLSRTVDDENAPYRVDRSVTLPEGVTWRGANLQAGEAGINVVLVSSGSKLLDFDIRGTGTISLRKGGASQVNERAVYPAHDALCNAVVEGRISNITLGVHLQPVNSNGVPPESCQIDVVLTDIVGNAGTSEGYGVLLSPALRCSVRVKASRVQRHAVYLSAGASYNVVEAVVADCRQDAVTIYSLASQPASEHNRLSLNVSGVRVPDGEPVSSSSSCFSIYGKANRNSAHVIASARGGTEGPAAYAAVLVRGLEGPDGPFPEGNSLTVDAYGVFGGPYAVVSSDAIDTVVEGGRIDGRGSAGVIGFTDTRSNSRSFCSAGRVLGVTIDGLDSSVAGVVVATERSSVFVASSVKYGRVLRRVKDVTGMLRQMQ